jgi:hypothetical protein
MAKPINTFVQRLTHRRMLRRWTRNAELSATMDVDRLGVLRGQAQQLRRQLERVIQADGRRGSVQVADGWPVLGGTDWLWRPEPWSSPMLTKGFCPLPSNKVLGQGVTLFHDCQLATMTLRQQQNTSANDHCPFGLRIEVFDFSGSFLSIAFDLPAGISASLTNRHVVRLECNFEQENTAVMYARLNVKQGPNVAQILHGIPVEKAGNSPQGANVDFDLAYARLEQRAVDKAWVDLILDRPQMNQITLKDVLLSRRLRADL